MLERRCAVKVFQDLGQFAGSEGVELGTSDWVQVSQKQVDLFAEATGDHQWIHVDPERAKGGPFGTTIAHGFLTLSLLPGFLHELYTVEGIKMAVNVGLNKVRFLAPVPVDARVRGAVTVGAVTKLENAVQAVMVTTIELEGSDKPAAVVESIVRYFG